MAGEWIKVQASTGKKPEVLRIARMLGISRREALGLLLEFWVWVDNATVDGVVDGVGSHEVDGMMECLGFCGAMCAVGWLRVDDTGPRIELPNFGRHNGETAKKRALKNERQARWRENSVDGEASTTASTREEKRREDLKPAREKARSKPVDNSGNGVDWTDPRSVDAYGKRIGNPCRRGESIAQYSARLRGAA